MRRFYLTVSILLLLYMNGDAQTSHYTIRHYTSSNGLPQNSILHIAFDKDGFCWLATEGGLVRFDNKEFKTFATDNIAGLKDNRIHGLIITPQGSVYAKNLHGQEISTTPTNSLFAPSPILLENLSPYYYPMSGFATTNTQIGVLWASLRKQNPKLSLRQHYTCQNKDTYLVQDGNIYQINLKNSRLLKTWTETPFSTVPVGDYLIQLWKNGQVALWKSGALRSVSTLQSSNDLAKILLNHPTSSLWSPGGTFIFTGKCLYQINIENDKAVTAKKVLTDLPFD